MCAAESVQNSSDPYVNTPALRLAGGTNLSEARLTAIASGWRTVSGQVRVMDSIELGEIEPATTFGWVVDEQ